MASIAADHTLPQPSAGFTLIEMIVVLAVTGVIMAAAPLMLSNVLQRQQLAGAASAIAGTLREARIRAMATGRAEAFVADVQAHRYALAGHATWHDLPRNVGIDLTTTTADVVDPTTARIRFFPDGSSTGGGVTLFGQAGRFDIQVDWLSGRVIIRDTRHSRSRRE